MQFLFLCNFSRQYTILEGFTTTFRIYAIDESPKMGIILFKGTFSYYEYEVGPFVASIKSPLLIYSPLTQKICTSVQLTFLSFGKSIDFKYAAAAKDDAKISS